MQALIRSNNTAPGLHRIQYNHLKELDEKDIQVVKE